MWTGVFCDNFALLFLFDKTTTEQNELMNKTVFFSVGNDYTPDTALNTFLRDQRISVGTKHMCFQGGCGSCLVEAKLYEPISEEQLSYAVNSVS